MVVALEIVESLVLIGAHDIRDVLLGVYVANLAFRCASVQRIAYSLNKVSLAQSHTAIDEKRVVGRAQPLSNLRRGGARQFVRLTGDDSLERECRIQTRNIAVAHARRSRGGFYRKRRRGSSSRGLVGEQQPYLHRMVEVTRGQRLDAFEELVPDPLQHEAIGRDERKDAAIGVELERADPRLELLGREFLFEVRETVTPEAVHLRR